MTNRISKDDVAKVCYTQVSLLVLSAIEARESEDMADICKRILATASDLSHVAIEYMRQEEPETFK